jgi:hypothetical protein
MKVFAEFIYSDGISTIYKPVFIERDEKWEAYQEFNRLVNHYIANYDLIDGSRMVIVDEQNEAYLLERAEAFSGAFEGKDTMLFEEKK